VTQRDRMLRLLPAGTSRQRVKGRIDTFNYKYLTGTTRLIPTSANILYLCIISFRKNDIVDDATKSLILTWNVISYVKKSQKNHKSEAPVDNVAILLVLVQSDSSDTMSAILVFHVVFIFFFILLLLVVVIILIIFVRELNSTIGK
jgi:type IV secretory pathway VirB6-like protein